MNAMQCASLVQDRQTRPKRHATARKPQTPAKSSPNPFPLPSLLTAQSVRRQSSPAYLGLCTNTLLPPLHVLTLNSLTQLT